MSVRLRIDRLVVQGLPLTPSDRAALGRAVEGELTSLLSARGTTWPQAGRAVNRVSVPMRIGVGGVPAWGAAIAGSINDGIGQAVSR